MPGHYKKNKVAKAHPPGKPGAPNPEPSSPYLPGKSPHKLAKKHVVNDVNDNGIKNIS